MRIGHGYDLHRLEPRPPHGSGRAFVLGGIHFDHPAGPVAHSDGDALLHAVTDAILGALGQPDIGQLFPDQNPANEGVDSSRFLHEAARRMRDAGYAIGNVDCTVICEEPKISPRREEIAANIARILGCQPSAINVKGKTHERVDAVGEGRAIEVHASALLTLMK
ncbi:MAG: 2-C-methyl-D-erythritol 2,4-cyclodiphosphate synthase [Phycisphaerales bacterium]|nr:2-C-methyl-D-erythritol 2,4-cyclodiphosphate synthase [Phycisphaerales bacterium]